MCAPANVSCTGNSTGFNRVTHRVTLLKICLFFCCLCKKKNVLLIKCLSNNKTYLVCLALKKLLQNVTAEYWIWVCPTASNTTWLNTCLQGNWNDCLSNCSRVICTIFGSWSVLHMCISQQRWQRCDRTHSLSTFLIISNLEFHFDLKTNFSIMLNVSKPTIIAKQKHSEVWRDKTACLLQQDHLWQSCDIMHKEWLIAIPSKSNQLWFTAFLLCINQMLEGKKSKSSINMRPQLPHQCLLS